MRCPVEVQRLDGSLPQAEMSGCFWALAGREGGDTIVTHWMQTLKGDSAKVMLSGCFWALAGREGGKEQIQACIDGLGPVLVPKIPATFWSCVYENGVDTVLGWSQSWGDDFARLLPNSGFWSFMRAKRDGEAIRLMNVWMPRVKGNVHCDAFWRILGDKGGHDYLEAHYTPKLTFRQLRDMGKNFKAGQ
jgi:hypothetical protein